MKNLSILFLFCVVASSGRAVSYLYRGNFQNISVSSAECANLIDNTPFEARLFFTGPTHLTAVVHLEKDKQAAATFMDGLNLVGNSDGAGRAFVANEFERDSNYYVIEGDSLYDFEFLLMNVTVHKRLSKISPDLCRVTAELSVYR